jgi:transposase-like protein
MTASGSSSGFAGFRFPAGAGAVCCCLRYGLSYRDVAELLAERGLAVDLYRANTGTWSLSWVWVVRLPAGTR